MPHRFAHVPTKSMLHACATFVAAIVLATTVSACNKIDQAPITFAPYPDVDVAVTLLKVSNKDYAKVVYFAYTANVRSDTPVYFRYHMMAASVNGIRASRVREDTLHTPVSHLRLKVGKNVMHGYAVYPENIESVQAGTVKFMNLGLSRNPVGPSI